MPTRRDSKPLPESHPKKRQARVAQAAFLEAFKSRGTILGACRDIGVDRVAVRRWLEDPDFAAKFKDADEDVTDLLESAGMSAALKPQGTIDRIFLLKARRPEKYQERPKIGEGTGEIIAALVAALESSHAKRLLSGRAIDTTATSERT